MMNNFPLISVNMAAYNAGPYIAEAIQSVLDQTFQNWELIIINDCSTDNTAEEIARFTDPRIKVYTNEQNEGIVYTRNRMLHYSTGKYVAVLDADDVMLPERLAVQTDFLEADKNYGLVGSAFRYIFEEKKSLSEVICLYEKAEYFPAVLLLNNFFVHSSVIFRTDLAKQILYKPLVKGYSPSEDYQLYVEIALTHKVYNINKELVHYREHFTGISKTREDKINEHIDAIISDQLKRLHIYPSQKELVLHKSIRFAFDNLGWEHILDMKSWIEKLIKKNKNLKIHDNYFEEYFALKWFEIARLNANYGLKMILLYYSSSLSLHPVIGLGKRKLLFLRCLYECKKKIF